MAVTLDYAPGYAAVVNTRQAKLATQQAKIVAYDAAPTEAKAVGAQGGVPLYFQVGDETTTITTGTNKLVFSFPFDFHVSDVAATLAVASSSGVVTVDLNDGVASILSTKLTFDVSENDTGTAVAAAVISDTEITANTDVSVDIDVAGTGAKGLKIWITGYRV